jgi:hypothetical protein
VHWSVESCIQGQKSPSSFVASFVSYVGVLGGKTVAMSVLVSSLNSGEYCENLERKMKTCFNILQLSDK